MPVEKSVHALLLYSSNLHAPPHCFLPIPDCAPKEAACISL